MANNTKTQLAVNIIKRRKAKGWNQDDLAASVGVHVNTIKNIERGLSEGQPDTRRAIAEALGCELWELERPPQDDHDKEKQSDPTRAETILSIYEKINKLSDKRLGTVLEFLEDLENMENEPFLEAHDEASND